MCGISGIVNHPEARQLIHKMLGAQLHRGPDAQGIHISEDGQTSLGHNRLSIIDLSSDGNQPMFSSDRRWSIVFNGEVYNYLEIRKNLEYRYSFRTQTDTEVVLYAFIEWGEGALDRFIGMFAFAIRNELTGELFMARDRFGVKPFHYAINGDTLLFASEIKSIFVTGLLTKEPDIETWVEYYCNSLYDHSENTFWKGVKRLMPGCFMKVKPGELPKVFRWYCLEDKVACEARNEQQVMDELLYLLEDSVNLRFRADVPVGICLSGGLDSSLLYELVKRVKGKEFPIHAFTFYSNDERYDELPWVEKMFSGEPEFLHKCFLNKDRISNLAEKIGYHMDEPFGGIPTLGMSVVYEKAKELGITVLLDGNGLDEGWAGYDYYQRASTVDTRIGPVQNAMKQVFLKDVLQDDLLKYLKDKGELKVHPDPLVNLQLRDILYSKIPRAMRFADRNSMAFSLELREPFLDHRLIELGLAQPINRKIHQFQGKYLVRKLAEKILPQDIGFAPKRGVQTPQREWLANDLSYWVNNNLDSLFSSEQGEWFKKDKCLILWDQFRSGEFDNSFFVWQWVNTSLLLAKA